MGDGVRWMELTLCITRSDEGTRYLSYAYWELLAELAIRPKWAALDSDAISNLLVGGQEWDKLECRLPVVYMFHWPKNPRTDLERVMLSLFHHRPNAIKRLQHWGERRSKLHDGFQPEPFRDVCEPVQSVAPEYLFSAFADYTPNLTDSLSFCSRAASSANQAQGSGESAQLPPAQSLPTSSIISRNFATGSLCLLSARKGSCISYARIFWRTIAM